MVRCASAACLPVTLRRLCLWLTWCCCWFQPGGRWRNRQGLVQVKHGGGAHQYNHVWLLWMAALHMEHWLISWPQIPYFCIHCLSGIGSRLACSHRFMINVCGYIQHSIKRWKLHFREYLFIEPVLCNELNKLKLNELRIPICVQYSVTLAVLKACWGVSSLSVGLPVDYVCRSPMALWVPIY